MATPNIVPRADSEGQLGTSSKYWAAAYIDLIYVGAGKIGRDADNLLDFSTDNTMVLTLNGGNELVFNSSQIHPAANDGLGLGYGARGFSDLFLASGAVINFDNSDVTLTHAANSLTLDGGHLQLKTNFEARFGSSNRLRIFSDNTDGYITNTGADGDIIFQADNGSGSATAYLTLDGGGVLNRFHKKIRTDDNINIEAGTSGDFKIYHNGTNTALENETGDLYIINDQNDGDIVFQSDNGSNGLATYMSIDGGGTDINFFKDTHHIDNVTAKFGTGADLQISHNATDSHIANYAGDLYITQHTNDKDLIFRCDDGSGSFTTYFQLDGSSAAHNGSATTALFTNWPDNSYISLGTSHDLQIVHTGVNSVIQNLVGKLQILSFTDDLEIKQFGDDKDIIFYSDDGSGGVTPYLTLDGGFSVPYVALEDNTILALGTHKNLLLTHDGTDSKIDNMNTGDLKIRNFVDDKDIVFQCDDGSGGIATYFTVDGGMANSGTLYTHWPDNSRIALGSENTQGDLNIYHNATDSFINNFTGDLYIRNNANDKDIIFQSDDGSGGVETYFFLDGSENSANPFTVFPDNSILSLGSNYDLQLYHNGTHSNIGNYVGDLIIFNHTNDGDILFQSDDGSGGTTTYFQIDGGSQILQVHKDLFALDNIKLRAGNAGDLSMFHNATNSFIQNETGNLSIINYADDGDVIFQSDNGSGGVAEYFRLDGGAAITIVSREMRFTDNVKAKFGTAPDLEIYHDGSNSYIADVGTGTLNISGSSQVNINAANGENGIQVIENGGVKIRHNNVAKLETTSAGVEISQQLSGIGAIDYPLTIISKDDANSINQDGTEGVGIQFKIAGNDNTTPGNSFLGASIAALRENVGDAVSSAGLGFFVTQDDETLDQAVTIKSDLSTTFTGDLLVNTTGGYVQVDVSDNSVKHADNTKAKFGTGNDLQIFHDGSDSFIKDAGTGNLNILATHLQIANAAYNNFYMTFVDGGAATIFHNGGIRLKTTTTGIQVSGATGNAAGAGFNTTNTVAIDVGEINGEIITTIKVDLGTGAILSSSTAGDVIGEDDTEGAFLTRITTAVNGIVYRGEMICVEVPTTGDPDINLAANSSATLAEDGAGEGEHVLINGGTATLAKHYPSFTIPSGGIQNDHLYLTHGGTTAGTYGAGQFIIKLYGAAVVS